MIAINIDKAKAIVHDKRRAVRGLLCQQCNSVLGYAKDNVETLLNAVSYLRKHYGW